jgi:hypothetical protein
MSKKPFPNPDFQPWEPAIQDQYLRYAREEYSRKCGNPQASCDHEWKHNLKLLPAPCPACPKPHVLGREVLDALYDEGRLRGWLRMPFEAFRKHLLHGPPHWGRRVGHHWVDRHGVVHAKGSSRYRRKKEHHRRVPNEATRARADWRDRKGFERDHQRSNWNWGSRKTFAKRQSNRLHRRWERQSIQREKWDDQISDFRKWTHDPWMWD